MLTHSVLTLFTSGNTFSPACMWLITGSSWTVFSEHSLSQSSTEHSVDRPKCTRESTFSSFRSHIKNVHKKKHQTATPPQPVSAVPSLIHCLWHRIAAFISLNLCHIPSLLPLPLQTPHFWTWWVKGHENNKSICSQRSATQLRELWRGLSLSVVLHDLACNSFL